MISQEIQAGVSAIAARLDEVSHELAARVVLGTGEGAKYIAWTLAKQGSRVSSIERKYIGGSCPNIACLPSKNVIHSAKVASYFQRGEEFGILADKWTVSMPGVRARKRQMVEDLVQMHLDNFRRTKAELVMGEGRFIADRTLKVSLPGGGERIVRGEQVFINTGTRAYIGNAPGLVESSPLTHVEALELDIVPEHLLILGGGSERLERVDPELVVQPARPFGPESREVRHRDQARRELGPQLDRGRDRALVGQRDDLLLDRVADSGQLGGAALAGQSEDRHRRLPPGCRWYHRRRK